jgi:hypothetical protein
MPKAYSLDLRERVARFVGSGRSRHAAADVNSSCIVGHRSVDYPLMRISKIPSQRTSYDELSHFCSVGNQFWRPRELRPQRISWSRSY